MTTIVLACLVAFKMYYRNTKSFTQNRVALIDSFGDNHLFRGNNPFIEKNGKKQFAYKEITHAFNNILGKNGKRKLTNYYLVSINLLEPDQYEGVVMERRFFKQNQELGEMIHISTIIPVLMISTNIFPEYYNNILSNVVDNIYTILNTKRKDGRDVLVYIHCDAGRDRTGMLTSIYKMKYQNKSLTTVKSENISESGRDSNLLYSDATAKQCLYIEKNLLTKSNLCANR